MSDSIYRDRGMHRNVPPATVGTLLKRYLKARDRRARQGFFLGTDFLLELAESLKKDGYDGLLLRFGLSGSSIDLPPVLELVGTPVELDGGDAMTIKREGIHYCTVGLAQTNPPSLPSPPMGGGSDVN